MEDFIRGLKAGPPPPAAVFNPWWQTEPLYDASAEAPTIRRAQLHHYLTHRLGRARWILIGEALSYNGGHFTGMAMTSERILLGQKIGIGIRPDHVLPGMTPQRTSKPSIRSAGFSEPTGSMVWGALLNGGLAPGEFVLWNAFPWHPFNPKGGLLSNRQPRPEELPSGQKVLVDFLRLFPACMVVALGKVAARQLADLGVAATCVRHPACGGARLFRQQIDAVIRTQCR